jgi:hypothetical protein
MFFHATFDALCARIDFHRGVRLLGITVYRFTDAHIASLFTTDHKHDRLAAALDLVTKKYGPRAWKRGSTMNTQFFERTSGWHYDAPE